MLAITEPEMLIPTWDAEIMRQLALNPYSARPSPPFHQVQGPFLRSGTCVLILSEEFRDLRRDYDYMWIEVLCNERRLVIETRFLTEVTV